MNVRFRPEAVVRVVRKVAFRAPSHRRESHPGLFAAGPYMHVRFQPAGIVQRSGFNRYRTAAPFGFVVYPRTALRAEGTELGSTASGFRCEGFHVALGEPKVCFVDDQGHAKRAAGLSLTIGAMADNELTGCSYHFIANVAALTASCIFGSHNFNPPGV